MTKRTIWDILKTVEWSKCHDCLRFGKECHPTPEQFALAWDECPDYDSMFVADWLTEDLYPFGIGMPHTDEDEHECD
jgi:hypothetical protein